MQKKGRLEKRNPQRRNDKIINSRVKSANDVGGRESQRRVSTASLEKRWQSRSSRQARDSGEYAPRYIRFINIKSRSAGARGIHEAKTPHNARIEAGITGDLRTASPVPRYYPLRLRDEHALRGVTPPCATSMNNRRHDRAFSLAAAVPIDFPMRFAREGDRESFSMATSRRGVVERSRGQDYCERVGSQRSLNELERPPRIILIMSPLCA